MGDLSQKQSEIYWLYYQEKLTQKEIADRQGMTQQNVSKIISKIKEIKALKKSCIKKGVVTKHLSQKSKFWRYHALHFVVTPYYFYPRYAKIRKERGNYSITHRDWKIKLHKKKIEIVLRKGFDFVDSDKYSSMQKAENSLNRTLFETSNKFGFEYEKEGRIAIKLVKHHLARTNSSIGKAQKEDYIQIKGFDGKVWFLIDKSKGIIEHEYIHSDRLLSDSDRIEAFLNDLRENEDISLSGLHSDQRLITKSVTELTIQIKLHLEVMDEMRKTLKKIQKKV